jgi:hypothetical protein
VKQIKKIALVVLLFWVLAAPGFAAIRGAEWGMSKGQIRELEGKPEAEEEDRLIYLDDVGGIETQVVYLFNHREELFSIKYDFHLEQSFMMIALDQFDKISQILCATYGPPDSGDSSSDREKRLGMLAMERPLVESWDRDGSTSISHTLTPAKVYRHLLVYGNRALTDEYEAFCKEKQKEKF